MNASFEGLHRLETMLLHNKGLHYSHSRLLSINLKPLYNLKYLRIEQKEKDEDQHKYPINALQPLHNRNTLYTRENWCNASMSPEIHTAVMHNTYIIVVEKNSYQLKGILEHQGWGQVKMYHNLHFFVNEVNVHHWNIF